MKEKLLDKTKYHAASGTDYASLRVYNESGVLTHVVFERKPADRKNEIVEAAYLSDSEYHELKQKILDRNFLTADFEELFGIDREEPSEAGGRVVRWERLPNGKYKFKPSAVIVDKPERSYRTLEAKADESPKISKTSKTSDAPTADSDALGAIDFEELRLK